MRTAAILPPLDLTAVFTSWRFDPLSLVLAVLLGGWYWWAHRALARRGEPWPRGRAVAWGVGVGLIVLCGSSFLGVYADTLFWVRAAVVIVLLMVAPLLLAMGSPLALALATLPASGADRIRRVLASRTARVLTFPATGSVLLIVTPWLVYFTGYYEAALRSSGVDALLRVHLLVAGFLYFYARLQLDPVPHKYPHMISIAISFAEVMFDAALGLVLWLGPNLVAHDYYLALHRTWGPSMRTDQIVGAGILWILGDLAGLPFLGALLNRMSTDDRREAAEIDRELDAQDAVEAAAADLEPGAAAEPTRLWWETDPVLAERFRRYRQ
ncbi:MAG TPA: cytochrome c oxidase assembly protein [Pseudonocardiaceae bacterium]